MTSKRGHLDYVFNNAGIAIGGGAVATYAQSSLVGSWTSTGVLHGAVAAYRLIARPARGMSSIPRASRRHS